MPASALQRIDLERLRSLTDELTLQRGADYAREQRVQVLERGRSHVRALVQGRERYSVQLTLKGQQLIGQCSCPVSQGLGFCKHCVAVALALNEQQFERRPKLDGHVDTLGAEVLMPYLPERDRASLRYLLGRTRLVDLASTPSARDVGHLFAHAPRLRDGVVAAAHAFLEDEARTVAKARAEIARRTEPPIAAEAQALFAVALALRARHPAELAPRALESLNPVQWVDDGLQWQDDRPHLTGSSTVSARPRVSLQLAPSEAMATCPCCEGLCQHTLAATDAMLEWLRMPMTQERREQLVELRRPRWERALRAMGQALEAARPVASGHVSWRLAIDERGVRVQPFFHRLGAKGRPSAGTPLWPARLTPEQQALITAHDHRVLHAARGTSYYADQRVLLALAGHPRVVLAEAPDAQVQVEAAKIGLLADHRGDSVVLMPALDGAPLPPHIQESLERESARYLYDGHTRTLTVLELPPEVARTLAALVAHGNDFPPQSHAALVEQLSALSARVPVAMPRTVMGESLPPRTDAALTLELQPDGSLRTELRIRPLPGAPSFVPGEGARDVHVRRDEKPYHARRDFEAERAAAEGWRARLPYTDDERATPTVDRFVLLLPDPQRGLAFLADLEEQPGPWPTLEWMGARLQTSGRAQTTSLKITLDRRRDWFGVSGGLSVDGERVTLAVLLDAARRKDRFVPVEGSRYVELTSALRQHLERLSDHTYAARHGLEVGPSAVEALQRIGDDGASVDADLTWQALSRRIFLAKSLSPRVPSGLKAQLRDYQQEGFRWMARLASWGAGAVLADDMGLGKTVQTLALLLDRARLGPQLVLAPTSVGFNWMEEAARFAPRLRLRLYAESSDRFGTLTGLGPRDVLVVSYGLMARDADRLAGIRFATIVFDEAQALKNALTQRARAARRLQGDFKVALSGTPLENHLGELWSLFRTVFPGLLGSWEAFRDRFATPIEKRTDPTAAPALARVLQPFLLRRTKAQVARELPPRTDLRVPVVLSPAEWQLYEDARLAALSELESSPAKLREEQRRVQVLAALTRLRLLASHPRLYDRQSTLESSKLKRLLELLDELRQEGHRALVFSQFTSHLALVREALDARGVDYLYLDGQTSLAERRSRVRAMQEGAATVFLISLKAGGVGLNLTAADNVIHLDPWWNPAVEDQASDRAHRIGQHRPVTVYRLVSRGTIEEQILALHADKRALVEGVLEGKDQAGRLSTRELISLLSAPSAREDESPARSLH